MKKRFSIRALGVSVLGSFAFAIATGGAAAQSADEMAKVDTNGDGEIAWEELQDMRVSVFERLDRNGDGVISSDDQPGFGPAKRKYGDAFERVKASSDANGDGQVTDAEMLEAPSPMFVEGDTNEDGILSAEEISALRGSVSG